jgi:alpha-N-acetylglucosamine transferase
MNDRVPESCAFTSQHSNPELAQTEGADPAVGPLGFMNGGLQVVNPSSAVYDLIVAHMESDAVIDMDFADQSLLSELFKGCWVPLPYIYNALKTLRWEGVHPQIWRDDKVKNVHYILAPKPWDEMDAEGNNISKDPTHEWWVKDNQERLVLEKEKGIKADGF